LISQLEGLLLKLVESVTGLQSDQLYIPCAMAWKFTKNIIANTKIESSFDFICRMFFCCSKDILFCSEQQCFWGYFAFPEKLFKIHLINWKIMPYFALPF